MKTFTIEDIRSWDPCYDPIKYLPEGWSGTALDILKNKEIPLCDQFWCVYRDGLISDKILRLFAVWSYRQTLKFIEKPDPRSLNAALVAEAYALGKATQEELTAAESAAWSAAESAWSAAESAAESAWSAARSAARSAWSAAESARSAARSAWSAARSAQRDKLIELLEQET